MCVFKYKFYTVCNHRGGPDDLHCVSLCGNKCPPRPEDKTVVQQIPMKCPYCKSHPGAVIEEPLKTPMEHVPMDFPHFKAGGIGAGLWPNAPNTPPKRERHNRTVPGSTRYAPSPDDSPTPKMSAKMMKSLSASKLSGLSLDFSATSNKTPSRMSKLDDRSSDVEAEESNQNQGFDDDEMDCDDDSMVMHVKKQRGTKKKSEEVMKSPIQTRSRSKQMGL